MAMIIIRGTAAAPGVCIGQVSGGGGRPVNDNGETAAVRVLVCRDLDALILDNYPAGSIGGVAAENGSRRS
jgi:hypothetical protein